jgi:hypothetical protein
MHFKLPSVNHSTYTSLGEAAEFVKVDSKVERGFCCQRVVRVTYLLLKERK